MTISSYLFAAAALSHSFDIGAERLIQNRFESSGTREYRLALHLDWLLEALRSGDVPQGIDVNDNRELRFAANSIINDWSLWWNAISQERISDHDIDLFTQNMVRVKESILGVLAAFPDDTETYELRRVDGIYVT